MLPSLILATKLLKVSGPFIASFLPERQYDEDNGRVEVPPVVSLENVALAFKELEDIACQTRVREDESKWPNMGRHGIILPTGSGIKPGEPVRDGIDAESWEKATERDMDAGLRFRRLTIHLASQFGDTLESLVDETPHSEQYLQAAFTCAITLVHEIAHLINASNFEHCTWVGEPRVNAETVMELGTSLVGWLFDGWIPENISLNLKTHDDYSFQNGCCWYKQLQEPRGYPQYYTLHSMPMAHIKRIFSKAEWDRFNENDPRFSVRVRKELLRPELPFRAGETARIAWKRQAFRVDLSPTLDQYCGIWDYHDPDWLALEPGQGGGTTGAPSPGPFLATNPSPELSPGQTPKKAVNLAERNSPVACPGKINRGECEQGQQNQIPLGKQESEDMGVSTQLVSSSHKPNHSVKRSPRPQSSSKQQKGLSACQATRRSRRLLGQPAEHAGGLPHLTRKKANRK